MRPSMRASRRLKAKIGRTHAGRGYRFLLRHYVTVHKLRAGAWKRYPDGETWCGVVIQRLAAASQVGGYMPLSERRAIAGHVRRLRNAARASIAA